MRLILLGHAPGNCRRLAPTVTGSTKKGRHGFARGTAKQPSLPHRLYSPTQKQGGRARTEGRLVRCPGFHVSHVSQMQIAGDIASGGWAPCGFGIIGTVRTSQDLLEGAPT